MQEVETKQPPSLGGKDKEEAEKLVRAVQKISATLFRSTLREETTQLALRIGVALIAVFAVAVLVLSILAGARSHSVKTGHAVGPVRIVGLGLVILPIQAAQADVAWTRTDTTSPPIPRDLFYLGSSGGISVFYNPVDRSALRLPDSSIAVRVK
jgi:hypothetical protein